MHVIAENLQPFDRRAAAAFSGDTDGFVAFLREIERTGASHIDINPGKLGRDAGTIVRYLVGTVETHSNLSIVIDSADPSVIETALACAARRPMINAYSMDERKIASILPLAARYEADIAGLVMTATSVPATVDEKLLLADGMIAAAEAAGVPRSRIILDPVVAPLGWQDGTSRAMASIEFIRTVRTVFGPEIRTMAGISNLTTRAAGSAGSAMLPALYLSQLLGAGLDYALMDVFNPNLLRAARLYAAFEGGRAFAPSEFD